MFLFMEEEKDDSLEVGFCLGIVLYFWGLWFMEEGFLFIMLMGIVVGVFLVLVLVGVFIFFIFRRFS